MYKALLITNLITFTEYYVGVSLYACAARDTIHGKRIIYNIIQTQWKTTTHIYIYTICTGQNVMSVINVFNSFKSPSSPGGGKKTNLFRIKRRPIQQVNIHTRESKVQNCIMFNHGKCERQQKNIMLQ